MSDKYSGFCIAASIVAPSDVRELLGNPGQHLLERFAHHPRPGAAALWTAASSTARSAPTNRQAAKMR
jgi:hypothetical protein